MDSRAAGATPTGGSICSAFSLFAACLCRITSVTDTSMELPTVGGGGGGGGGRGGHTGVEVRIGGRRGVEHGVLVSAGRGTGPETDESK